MAKLLLSVHVVAAIMFIGGSAVATSLFRDMRRYPIRPQILRSAILR
ncbi:hypothetical protein [Nocardia panacis]